MVKKGLEVLGCQPLVINVDGVERKFSPITMGDLSALAQEVKDDVSRWIKKDVRLAEQQKAIVAVAKGDISSVFSSMYEPQYMMFLMKRSYKKFNDDEWSPEDLPIKSANQVYEVLVANSMPTKEGDADEGDTFQ